MKKESTISNRSKSKYSNDKIENEKMYPTAQNKRPCKESI